MIYQASVVYWAGDPIEDSEPAYVYGPECSTQAEAVAWGERTAKTPSPWPGRDYDDYYQVIEYEPVDTGHDIITLELRTRWTYSGGKLDDTTTE